MLSRRRVVLAQLPGLPNTFTVALDHMSTMSVWSSFPIVLKSRILLALRLGLQDLVILGLAVLAPQVLVLLVLRLCHMRMV